MFIGQLVTTPYGVAEVQSISSEEGNDKIVVTPTTWTMAGGQKPTFYCNALDVKTFFHIGETVQTSYGGEGRIMWIRDTDGMYVVHLNNWVLANKKSPILYLNQSSVHKTKHAKISVQKSNFEEQFAKAVDAKAVGTELYKASDVEKARNKYLEALEILRDVGDVSTLSNEERAKAFEQNVLCYNNVALCCLLLKDYSEAAIFANNALLLVNTLQARIPEAKIWEALVEKQGFTMDKLLKGIKKKSHFYVGKAELYRKNYSEALDHFEKSLKLIDGDTNYLKEAKQLKDFIATTNKQSSAEKKREKDTWSKAFSKSKKEYAEVEEQSPAKKNMSSSSMDDSRKPETASAAPVKASASFSSSVKKTVDLGNGVKVDMSALDPISEPKTSSSSSSKINNSSSSSSSKTGSKTGGKNNNNGQVVAADGPITGFYNTLMGMGLLSLVGGGLFWWLRIRSGRR